MLFNTILASTIALAVGASAAPAPDANPRYAQLRIFGEPGCSELNQGEIGVYGEQLNKCQTFGDTKVRSVSFEYKLLNNCTLTVFNDVTCHLSGHVAETHSCVSGDKSYGSYYVDCKTQA
ncbi:hypothetical protein N7492_006582 [Penicillium capsulatum]|uniref:Uncharacterized protein n=1 Tax=Penicillium capsulatum TaxID=69766 RepID=A0A9W9I1N7_9EURO|nr:hypothetical protein N7492_006582 [Penicillium capsulatum]KAJ6116417.1 hypothetical protein N7512_006142 [Penicillium capsulatum]